MYPRFFQIIALAALAISVASCTTTSPNVSSESVPSQQPVSTRPTASPSAERARVHTELGSEYMHAGQYAIALEEARIALGSDASYAPAYNLLALTHFQLGEINVAVQNIERALSLAPGDPEFSNNYGWFLCQQPGKERKSFEHFLRAAKNPLYTSPTRAYTNLGICQGKVKDYGPAMSNLMLAFRLDPANTLAIFNLSDLAFAQGQMAEAKQWMVELEKRIELTSQATWLALRIERKMGNREGEARYSSQLRKKFVGTPELQKLLRGEFE